MGKLKKFKDRRWSRRIRTIIRKPITAAENFYITHKYVSGVTVIEMVLILVILIALLVIFKDQLTTLINTIFEKVTSESAGI